MSSEIVELLKNFRLELKKDMEESRKTIVNDIKEYISLLDSKDKIVESQIKNLDREMRKRNIVIYGIADQQSGYWEIENCICSLLREKLGLEIAGTDIDFIRRLGRWRDDKNLPILLGFTTFRMKVLTMQNVHKLRGSQIFISNDFPKEVRAIRKNLWPQLVEARNAGKQARLVYDKLIIKEENAKYLNKKRQLSDSPPIKGQSQVQGKSTGLLHRKNKKINKIEDNVKIIASSASLRPMSPTINSGQDAAFIKGDSSLKV